MGYCDFLPHIVLAIAVAINAATSFTFNDVRMYRQCLPSATPGECLDNNENWYSPGFAEIVHKTKDGAVCKQKVCSAHISKVSKTCENLKEDVFDLFLTESDDQDTAENLCKFAQGNHVYVEIVGGLTLALLIFVNFRGRKEKDRKTFGPIKGVGYYASVLVVLLQSIGFIMSCVLIAGVNPDKDKFDLVFMRDNDLAKGMHMEGRLAFSGLMASQAIIGVLMAIQAVKGDLFTNTALISNEFSVNLL